MTTPSGTFVGIDVSTAQFECGGAPDWRTLEPCAYGRGDHDVGCPPRVTTAYTGGVRGDRGLRDLPPGSVCDGGLADRRRQSSASPRLRQSHGASREDRYAGGPGLSPVCRGGLPDPTAAARCADARAGRTAHASAPT